MCACDESVGAGKGLAIGFVDLRDEGGRQIWRRSHNKLNNGLGVMFPVML